MTADSSVTARDDRMTDRTPARRDVSVWVLCTGEPLPLDRGDPRLLRAGLLCDRLSREGFRVEFWSSNFDHSSKKHRSPSRTLISHTMSSTYRIHLLPSSGYARNMSLARILDHRQIGRAFLDLAADFTRPHVLIVSMPTIDLAYAGARYAVEQRVPFILDLRDLWPEIFYLGRRFPQKQVIRLLTAESSRRLNWALRRAAAVVGITDDFVAWGCKRSGRERRADDVALPLAYRPAEPPMAEELVEQHRMTEAGILRPDQFQVCFLGSISPRMDLRTLCEAGARARALGLPLHLVIAGTGEALDELRSAYAATNVRFLGWVNQTAIRAILRTSKAGAVPYRNSIDFQMSIPNKAIEYLSHGVPILTSLRGTLARLVEGEALGAIYSEGDADTLLDRIKAYCDDVKRQALHSANALNVFYRRFSTDVVFSEYVGLVQRVASAGRGASGCGS